MKSVLPVLLLLASAVSISASAAPDGRKLLENTWAGNAISSIPAVRHAPKADGIVSPGEWDNALEITGFQQKELLVPERFGSVSLMHDDRFLYVLVRTSTPNNDPDGGLITRASRRDGAVYDDDSVEMMFLPDGEKQVRHLIFNANKVLFDRLVDPATGKWNGAWNLQNHLIGSRAESGVWTLEAALPLDGIGMTNKRKLRFNFARNWQGFGASTLNPADRHTDPARMFYGVFSWKSPVVRLTEIGSPENGRWRFSATATNPREKKLAFGYLLRNFTWPVVNGKTVRKIECDLFRIQEIAPGETAKIDFSYEADRRGRWFSVVLYDPATGEIFFRRLIRGRKGVSTGRHPVSGTFSIPGFGDGFFRHYPGYAKAVFECIPSASAQEKTFVLHAGGKSFPAVRHGRRQIAVLPLADGGQNVSYTLSSPRDTASPAPRFLVEIRQKRLPWQNNRLGCERIVLPPFRPLTATADGGLAALRTAVRFNGAGLPDSLRADGIELLAEPGFCTATINGKTVRFDAGKTTLRIAADGYDAQIETAASAGPLTLDGRIHAEYDGFHRHTLRLSGTGGATVSRLTLHVPFLAAETPLFHAVSNTIRTNPSGVIPAGSGTVWDGTKLPRTAAFGVETIHPALVPYLWLGGIERGWSWFVNSSFGMKLNRDGSAVRLVRSPGRVTLEIDLINRPVRLKDGHAFEFGSQATPVKAIDRRLTAMTYDAYGVGVRGGANAEMISEHILGYASRWAKTVIGGDTSLLNAVVRAVATGRDFAAARAQNDVFFARHGAEFDRMYLAEKNDPVTLARFKKIRRGMLNVNLGAAVPRASLPYKYSDPRLAYRQEETVRYFQCEWFNPSPQSYFGALRTSPTPTWIDFVLHGYNEEFANGMKGCYLDDMFLMPEINPHTMARIDNEGELHADTGIFALREMVKRIAVLQHKYGHSPRLLQVHMTNALLVPVFSFATSQLGWESDFGEKPLQLRYRDDAILAENTGLQAGLAPLALGGIIRRTTPPKAWQKKYDTLTRSALAMALPHGIALWLRASPLDASRGTVLAAAARLAEFGTGEPDCVFTPYFAAPPDAKYRTEKLLISSWSRPGKKLLVVSNRGGERVPFTPPGKYTALYDAETGRALAPGECVVEPYDFRLVEFRGASRSDRNQ